MRKNKMPLSLDEDTIVQEVADGKARPTPNFSYQRRCLNRLDRQKKLHVTDLGNRLGGVHPTGRGASISFFP